jgi:hypothetical protein
MRTSRSEQVTGRIPATCGIVVALLALAGVASAQTPPPLPKLSPNFNGSTGADGPFDLSSASGSVNFEPAAIETALGHPLKWDDHRFDFTTINIPAGVTVKMSAKWTNGPIYWLATGDVSIAGTIDLSGDNGSPVTTIPSNRFPAAVPGPGGFPGGPGGSRSIDFADGIRPPQSGGGPGGGAAGQTNGGDGWRGAGGSLLGIQFLDRLVPLVGGSGGGGSIYPCFQCLGAGGGGGGGALLIASSSRISIPLSGRILANGGKGGMSDGNCNQYYGGSGGGGAVRIVAPELNGTGTINVNGGPATCLCNDCSRNAGGAGRVRLEYFQQTGGLTINGSFTSASPVSTFVPPDTKPATVVIEAITMIGGATIFLPTFPTASFVAPGPDATVTKGDVRFVIRARGVPVQKTVELHLFSPEAPDKKLTATLQDDPVGTYTTSAVIETVLPSGYSRGYVRAKW